jgi:hypothetical protein
MCLYCLLKSPQKDFKGPVANICFITTWLAFTYFNCLNPILSSNKKQYARTFPFRSTEVVLQKSEWPPWPLEHEDAKNYINYRYKVITRRPTGFYRRLLNFGLVYHLAYMGMSTSFLWQLLWLSFAFIYGVLSVTATWISPTSSLDESGLRSSLGVMGFGQYVSLFLLGLPLLAAWEALIGKSGRLASP